jgi:hypothetical protein
MKIKGCIKIFNVFETLSPYENKGIEKRRNENKVFILFVIERYSKNVFQYPNCFK